MAALSGRVVLLCILGISVLSALFCIVGIAAPGWGYRGLFRAGFVATGALTIISLLLLICCIVVIVVILTGAIQQEYLPIIFVALLIVTTLILLGAVTSVFAYTTWYAYNLIISAFAFTYISSLLGVYWYCSLRSTN